MEFTKKQGILGIQNAKHLVYRTTFRPDWEVIKEVSTMTAEQAYHYIYGFQKKGPHNCYVPHSEPIAVLGWGRKPWKDVTLKYFISTLSNPRKGREHLFIDLDKNSNDPEIINNNNEVHPHHTKWAVESWYMYELLHQKSMGAKASFFLYNQFPVSFYGPKTDYKLYLEYNKSIWDYLYLCLQWGSSRGLSLIHFVERLVRNNAMQYFLDNNYNKVNNINENFGRELLELHTVQQYPDGSDAYTNKNNDNESNAIDDVHNCARVLTGWHPMPQTLAEREKRTDYLGVPLADGYGPDHDPRKKYFSKEHFGGKSIHCANQHLEEWKKCSLEQQSAQMRAELGQFAHMLYLENSAKNYTLAKNLYHYYAYTSKIEESSQNVNNIIEKLQNTLNNNRFSVADALYKLVTSEEFYDEKIMGTKVKSPLEFILIALNHLGMRGEHPSIDLDKNYIGVTKLPIYQTHIIQVGGTIKNKAEEMGMPLFNTEVHGFTQFREEPYDLDWFTTDAAMTIETFIDYLFEAGHPWGGKNLSKKNYNENQRLTKNTTAIDWLEERFNHNPKYPKDLVAQMLDYFIVLPINESSDEFKKIYDVMLDGLSEKNWELEWEKYYLGNTGKVENWVAIRDGLITRIADTSRAIMMLPEYQFI